MPWPVTEPMRQRTEFALRALETDNFRQLCREYGISPRVGYKWKQRLLEHGLEGMGERSRRPHKSPSALSEEEVCRIVRLRVRHPRWGARKLREVSLRQHGSAASEASIKRVLERAGMVEKRRCRKARDCGRIATGRKAQGPNEVWTVDFKGSWHDCRGRCEPLTVRDEYSRYVLELRALSDARTSSVRACFERLFERHGLPSAIRSDNGPPFASNLAVLGLSRLSAWWVALGIDLERGRPAHPQDNGAHERFHLDVARELEGVGYAERQATFDLWRAEYNQERPHEALGMRPPAELYRNSERRWEGTPEQIAYQGMERRRVLGTGAIAYGGVRYQISTALRGWDLGLAKRADGRINLHFARLLLGVLEPESAAFVPALGAGRNQKPQRGECEYTI